jgi:hypothetical protein
MRITKLTACAAIAVAAVFSSAAAANTQRVTEGDATAVLQSFGNGGWAIIKHARVVEGAPADGLVGGLATIRPFDFFKGKHYCALDWHALVLADIEGGDASFTRAEAEATISQLDVTFTLDDETLAVTQTAVKAFLNPDGFGLTTAYYSQWGHLLAPDDLGVGSHAISATMTFAGKPVFRNKISVVVDAPGTGVCV